MSSHVLGDVDTQESSTARTGEIITQKDNTIPILFLRLSSLPPVATAGDSKDI